MRMDKVMANVAIVAAFVFGMASLDVSSLPSLKSILPTAAELHRALPAYANNPYGFSQYEPCDGLVMHAWKSNWGAIEAGGVCYGAVQVSLGIWATHAGAANWWSELSEAEAGWPPARLTEHFPKAVHLVTIWDEVNSISLDYSDWAYFSVGHAVGYVWITVTGPSTQPLTTLLALTLSKLPASVTG